jgi:uncharacterized protein GlcG (DUF336 family)
MLWGMCRRLSMLPYVQERLEESMRGLTLAQAVQIANAALAKARELDCNPLTIAVVDPGGYLLVLMREDGSGNLRPDIAFAKAWGAVGMGLGGQAIAKRAGDFPQFWAALYSVSSGRIVPAPGGVLVLHEGQVIGAVGISGDAADVDESCAVAGVRQAGFEAEVGEGALGKQ